MSDRWRHFQTLRRFSNPKTTTWMQTDPARREKYLKLRALGFKHSSARKYTGPTASHIGDRYIEHGYRRGLTYAIVLPHELRDESIENKVRIALGLLGEGRLRALGESKPSLEAELIGEAKQIESEGGDVNSYIENKVNALRLEARAVRSSVPIDRAIETSHGVVHRELPAHVVETTPLEVEQRFLEHLESFAENSIEEEGLDISPEVKQVIMGKALAPAKALMRQGVRLDRENIIDLARDIKGIVSGELAKLRAPVEARSDNPAGKMYYLRSTRTDRFPYKQIEGKADFAQLMVIASKAAKSVRSPKPRTLASAVRVLDKAGFKVAEVR